MDTSVQLFRSDRKLSACALGEPSLTLIQNDDAFGLLLSQGARDDAHTRRFYLNEVWYLHVRNESWSYTSFSRVAIYERDGNWVAEDVQSGRFFPHPSRVPYHVVFLPPTEYAQLRHFRMEGLAYPVFEAAQSHFGRLPGFRFDDKTLSTPDDYAMEKEAIPRSDYVVESGEF